MHITYNDPKTLSGEVFRFLAVNTENLKSKFSKSLPFRKLETVPNYTIPKDEKYWKDETNGGVEQDVYCLWYVKWLIKTE